MDTDLTLSRKVTQNPINHLPTYNVRIFVSGFSPHDGAEAFAGDSVPALRLM